MRVLFVCVGNSCRSQMAEGWAKHLGIDAVSAGTNPGLQVAPNAVAVMKEAGIDISTHSPTHLDEVDHTTFDRVYSMGCGVHCPQIPLSGDWDLDDPVNHSIEVYRACRDEIEKRVLSLLQK